MLTESQEVTHDDSLEVQLRESDTTRRDFVRGLARGLVVFGFADTVADALRNRLEQLIAARVTPGVIDLLESVKIHIQQCEGPLIAAILGNGLIQPVKEKDPVGIDT